MRVGACTLVLIMSCIQCLAAGGTVCKLCLALNVNWSKVQSGTGYHLTILDYFLVVCLSDHLSLLFVTSILYHP